MKNLRNKVQLIGNLGADPVIRHFEGGKVLAKLSLATNESYKNTKGEKVQTTQWHNLIAWGGNARVIEQYLQKGSEIAIEGRLDYQTYEDKEGVKKYFTQVVINELLMLK